MRAAWFFLSLLIAGQTWAAPWQNAILTHVVPAISAISFTASTLAAGAASGSVAGSIAVAMSPPSPAFSGTGSLQTSGDICNGTNGANNGSFTVSGVQIKTASSLAAGTYNICYLAQQTGLPSKGLAITITVTGGASVENVSYSASLWASHPFYTCVTNYYIDPVAGLDTNNGLSGHPWQTAAHAASINVGAGACINVASGTINLSAPIQISHGGSSASLTGFVVWRSQTAVIGAHFVGTTSFGYDMFSIVPGSNYVIIDGLEVDGNNNTVGTINCIGDYGAPYGSATAGHHLVVIDNYLHGCGGSGFSAADTDYVFSFNNEISKNSNTNQNQGSGLNYVVFQAVSGYTPTSWDNQFAPFHGIMALNWVHDNTLTSTVTTTHTDGNDIIVDTMIGTGTTLGDPRATYTAQLFVGFNVTARAGGGGVHIFTSDNVTVVNNTAYDNNHDTLICGSTSPSGCGLGNIGNDGDTGDTFKNNIGEAIANYGNNGNFGMEGSDRNGITNSGSVFQTNIAYGTGTAQGNYNFQQNDATKWAACSGNLCGVDPMMVNPGGSNFALQSGSPAIGYGTPYTVPWDPQLTAQSVDAGACFHTLANCPPSTH